MDSQLPGSSAAWPGPSYQLYPLRNPHASLIHCHWDCLFSEQPHNKLSVTAVLVVDATSQVLMKEASLSHHGRSNQKKEKVQILIPLMERSSWKPFLSMKVAIWHKIKSKGSGILFRFSCHDKSVCKQRLSLLFYKMRTSKVNTSEHDWLHSFG